MKKPSKKSKNKQKKQVDEFLPFEESGKECEICGELLDMVDVVDGSSICWDCQEMLGGLDAETKLN